MGIAPKFMIAENPMAEQGAEYVYHTQKPRFLAKFTPDNTLSSFDIIDDIDSMYAFYGGGDEGAKKVAGLMRRLGDWWIAYCKWEEDNSSK